MSSIHASFAVPFQFSVIFLENVLLNSDSASELFANIAPNSKVLPVIEASLIKHDPSLGSQLTTLLNTRKLDAQPPLVLPGGEECKNTDIYVKQIIDTCIEYQIDRHNYILAIGGGAFLDMVGYAATICHRGIRLIRMPTTVLAQNDAGVGVKNAINYDNRKNFVGTFAPPYAVINSYHFIESLPTRDKRAGIAEAIKVSLIKDAEFFNELYRSRHQLKVFEPTCMQQMIKRCAELHLEHICHNGDPFERGSARPLDYGHWSAHALEEISNFSLKHGEAVALGLLIDSKYSQRMGWITETQFAQIEELIRCVGFADKHDAISSLDVSASLENFRAHLGGQLCITMLTDIGQCKEVNDINEQVMQECVSRHASDLPVSPAQTEVEAC